VTPLTRAIVLGAGGPVGIGWESGLIVGLAQRGVDVSTADAVFGTSAGSFVGAQLALGIDIASTASERAEEGAALYGQTEVGPVAEQLQTLMSAVTTAVLADTPPEETRRTIGRLSLESDVPTEPEFLRFFAIFEGQQWPEPFACTAVDTETGEMVVWKAGSGADLAHAVASSCSVPCMFPPVSIGGRRYMDGGARSSLNADLAIGHHRVVVISVSALYPPAEAGDPVSEVVMRGLATELETLRSSGSEVEVIEPNQEFLEMSGWGASVMDFDKPMQAFEIGVRQGSEEARRILRLWDR
jgi:NTE family protein